MAVQVVGAMRIIFCGALLRGMGNLEYLHMSVPPEKLQGSSV
jgi:hypothetical protein